MTHDRRPPTLDLIDTHCHLDFPQFSGDMDAVLARAQEAGVSAFINIGSSLKGSEDSVKLSERFPFIYAAVGIHPHDADGFNQQAYERIAELTAGERVVAVGEVGLDFFKNYSEPGNQEKMLARFLALANERSLPLVVHSRQADERIAVLLKEYAIKRAVVHCFSGSEEFLGRMLEAGYLVSFTCNITYKKSDRLRRLVKTVPLERLLLETDSPFLAPEGKRGQRNEPSSVRFLCEEIARIKEVSLDEVASKTTHNAKTFFGI